ncbi:MAG: diguanylate cyclase [Pelosinus sp.]|nr:diguanylate cyclase [Pelosinus sp.]
MGRKKGYLATLTCALILIATYIMLSIVTTQQNDKLRAELQGQLFTMEAKLEGGINSKLFLEKGINAFILTELSINPSHKITQQELDDFGKQFMPQLLAIRNITLIQNNIITHVYPLSGNEKAIGVDLSRIPAQQQALEEVVATGQSLLTEPVELAQGGVGIIHRSPIYWIPKDTNTPVYWGQTSLVLMQHDLFEEAGLYDKPNLKLAIRARDNLGYQGAVFWGDADVFNANPVIVDIKAANGYWQLAAVPKEGWNKPTSLIYWIVFIGSLFALATSALVWFLLCSLERRNQLKYVSFHDALTGLYNRAIFEEAISKPENKSSSIGLIICDLDGLKMINDTLGHEKGDQVLRQIARILKDCFSKNDIIARIGGDEFAVLVKNATPAQLKTAKENILKKISIYNNENPGVPLSLSIGYTSSADSCASIEDLYKKADNYMYREKLYQRKSTRSAIVGTILKLLEARDFITEGHANRLHDMVTALGKAAHLPEFRLVDLRLLAQFHDIGKVGIPDRILLKPDKLTAEEVQEMRRHSDIGYRIALSTADLLPIANFILQHHEWWNGAGYPLGLSGEDIPLECRILAIADAYDAMTNDRPYRKAMPQADAVAELKRSAGTQFDPALVEKFCKIIEQS